MNASAVTPEDFAALLARVVELEAAIVTLRRVHDERQQAVDRAVEIFAELAVAG